MKTVAKGLAALKAKQEEEAAKAAERDRPRADWLTKIFPKDVDPVKVVFLQELNEDSPNYNEENGLGTAIVEHTAPGAQGFKRRATCTIESEGQCYACEKHAENYREGWKQKSNFYINVSVEGHDGAFVLSRNFNSTFVQALIGEAEDEPSITDAVYRLSKTGSGKQTQWLFKRLKEEPWDVSGIKPWNLEEAVFHDIPYEKQPEFYGAVYSPEKPDEAFENPSTSEDVTPEW